MGGVVKGLLALPSGRTVLETLVERLGSHVDAVSVLAPPALLPRLATACSCRLVADPGLGPAHAMIRAARAASAACLWVVAADLPGLGPEHLDWLLSGALGTEDALIPVLEGRTQPLVGLYRRAALAALEPPEDGSVHTLLSRLVRRDLSAEARPEPWLAGLRGFNTWEEAEARWGIQRPPGLAIGLGPWG